jgi:hypothetical protein
VSRVQIIKSIDIPLNACRSKCALAAQLHVPYGATLYVKSSTTSHVFWDPSRLRG